MQSKTFHYFSPSRIRQWMAATLAACTAAAIAVGCARLADVPGEPPEAAAYRWLLEQQAESGLLGNQEDDALSGVYANAMAAICFVHRGDVARAERIFDVFAAQADEAFEAPGGFHQLWDVRTATPHRDSDRWLGDNAWLLIALNRYRAATGDDRYAPLALQIADWIVSLQDADGGIWSGFSKNGPIRSKSTEANLDCHAALVDQPEARARVRHWLETFAWLPKKQHFRMGSTVDEPALDGASWGIGSLGTAYAPALATAERLFRCTHVAVGAQRSITGFSDRLARDRIWFEGTGQMAVAYRVAGRDAEADFILGEMRKALVPGRVDPATAGLPWYSGKPDWEGGAHRIFTPSQAWYLLAEWKVNPMGEPPAKP